MAVRFRIRTSAGQELSFASEDTFEEFVRSGDLSPDDLVYDGETGSWSPARTHPIVLDIEYAREAEEEATADAAAAKAASAAADGDSDSADADEEAPFESDEVKQETESANAPDFGLDLAPAEELSPDEAARAFVEKMEAEREANFDFAPTDQAVGGFTAQDSTTLADMLAPAPEPPPKPRAPTPPVSRPRTPRREAPQRRERPERRESGSSTMAPGRGVGLEKAAASPGPGILRRAKGVLLLVGLVGAAGFVAYVVANGPADPLPIDDPTVPIEPVVVEPIAPTREPVIGTTPAAVRDRARERYLTATQNALRDLPPVPEIWPEGRYLSSPSEYPEVLDVWQTYLSTIRSVRQDDARRYRVAYDAALDDAVIEGDARAERLAAGLDAFAATSADREAHFARVESLASGAMQSHSALVEAEGLILFDPGGTAGGRNGLGVGAYGRDADSQLLLDQVLDLLSERLDGNGLGPRTGGNVREWVRDGLVDAVTR